MRRGALLGPVAQPHRPFAGQLAVVGDFLDRLGGEFGEEAVAGASASRW